MNGWKQTAENCTFETTNRIDHNIDVQSASSLAPKVARKCERKHWYACGADGGSVGHVITKFSGMGRFIYPWCSAGALRVRSSAKNCKNLVPHDFRFDDWKLGYTCASAFLSSHQNTITFVSHQKGLVTCSRCSDYGDGVMRCEQENIARGWVRDCFPLSEPSPLTPLSERLAQATSQGDPTNFGLPFHPHLTPTPPPPLKKKWKSKN